MGQSGQCAPTLRVAVGCVSGHPDGEVLLAFGYQRPAKLALHIGVPQLEQRQYLELNEACPAGQGKENDEDRDAAMTSTKPCDS